VARKNNILGAELKEVFEDNSRVFTFFVSALIVVVGIVLIENPSRWWVAILGLLSFFVVLFLFLNARVIIKATISIFSVLVLSSYGFRLGAMLDNTAASGTLWMTSTLTVYLLNLCYSFLRPSSKSRWGAATLVTVLQFMFSTALVASGINLIVPFATSMVLGLLLFVFVYTFGFRTKIQLEAMPLVGLDNDTVESIYKSALDNGWGAWLPKKSGSDSVIVWNDDAAYHLTSVFFDQKLGIGGSKFKQELTHNGKAVSNWLLNLVYKKLPFTGTGNADIMLVLLDEGNKNGTQSKVVGVAVPDSKKRIPVGILPAKSLMATEKHRKLLQTLDREFGAFPTRLSTRQLNFLDSHLPDGIEEANDMSSVSE
jgi:hypothetical protein